MATLASAKKKYRDKLAAMPKNYNESMADFLGVSSAAVATSAPGTAYAGKMKPGLEDKWERELKRAFGG